MTATLFLFVGERPSLKAARIGATWANGKLSAKNLHDALRAAGYAPEAQEYVNLWAGPEPGPADADSEAIALGAVREALAGGLVIVGMGERVCRVLRREGLPHLQLVHPAARGRIRKRERYQEHLRVVLGGRC